MSGKDDDNVVLVFEPACDAHWMKDVVQFPNALAQALFNKNAILVTRPNLLQAALAKHIGLMHLGNPLVENQEYFKSLRISELLTSREWYLSACKLTAKNGEVLVLYPWYGDPFKGARIFKVRRWLKFKKARVLLKTDGLLHGRSLRKAGFKTRVRDFFNFFFIDKIINENAVVDMSMRVNNAHLASKLVFLPNCPLDIYHIKDPIPYEQKSDRFLFVGRIDDEEKGADLLINAWGKVASKLDGWKLDMVGTFTANYRQILENKLENSEAWNSIRWLGNKNPEELLSYYQNSKIVVCPSRKESGPIVLTEAILCGCAFIGAAVGEIPYILEGLPGILNDEKSLAAVMLEFATASNLASEQAKILFQRVKDRKWSRQIVALVNH